MQNNTTTIEVIPGILEKSWDAIEQKILVSKPFASTLHIDIIDGIFVDNLTFLDPKPFAQYASTFTLELHMMVQDPISYVEKFARAGFTRFLGHIEMMDNQQEFIEHTKQFGEAGLALDGPTSLQSITVPLQSVDSFLIYTSERVGFSGPQLVPDRIDKIRQLREQTVAPIEVDGGITAETLPLAKKAGASRFTSTSFIFSGNSPQENYEKLTALL